MTAKSPVLPVLVTPARETSTPNRRQRRAAYTVPGVTTQETAFAIEFLCRKYPLLNKDELYSFVLGEDEVEGEEQKNMGSRRSCHAVVQVGWAMAKVELGLGHKAWYHKEWVPTMKDLQANGDALPEDMPEGKSLRVRARGRQMVTDLMLPFFGASAEDEEMVKTIRHALFGERGSHVLTTQFLLSLIHGSEAMFGKPATEETEEVVGWWQTMVAIDRSAEAESEAESDEESDSEAASA